MTTSEERKRKMLLFLPLLILPFLALGFYALGGGRGGENAQTVAAKKGINMQLPGAILKKGDAKDKMSLYDQAQKDSSAHAGSETGAFAALGWDTAKYRRGEITPVNKALDNENEIKTRLTQINKQISQPKIMSRAPGEDITASARTADLERLEKLLKQKQETNTPDPQMQQLSNMLDKIMVIQNPALAKNQESTISTPAKDTSFKAIRAVIEGNQKVAPGGVVKIRLQDSIRMNGLIIPKGQLAFGACSITNQRLLLDIKNIRLGTAIIPVNFTIFSLDGMPGIAAPEAELTEAAGGGANSALENMQFLSMDNSLSTQAASAGISAAKGLLGKKARKIRVRLHGGETVLLRINRS